jgi:hypothetical protein
MHRGEAPVHGGHSPAGVAAVHDVVVDQGGGLEHLEGGGDYEHTGGVGATRAAPAPVAERRPQPLAAAEQVADGVHQRSQVWAHRVEHLGLVREGVVERLLDPRAQVLGVQR